MTAEQVRRVVEEDIAGRWAESNDHGVDLRRALVAPRRVECRNTFPYPDRPRPKTLTLWVVLEETPGTADGYVILFDEGTARFGLGCHSQGGGIAFLGYHGSFWNTFVGM
jgi:hypothetical protein